MVLFHLNSCCFRWWCTGPQTSGFWDGIVPLAGSIGTVSGSHCYHRANYYYIHRICKILFDLLDNKFIPIETFAKGGNKLTYTTFLRWLPILSKDIGAISAIGTPIHVFGVCFFARIQLSDWSVHKKCPLFLCYR